MNIDKRVVIFLAIAVGLIVGFKFFKERIRQEVLLEMKRDYVPGPYHPGSNPDKVNPPNADASPEQWNKTWSESWRR